MGHNTSSTSVSVGWDAIPTKFIHGILLGYKVFYRKTSENPSQYKTLETDQLGISLTNLEKFTEYCVQLAGFTRIGDGNKSRCFNVTTDQDGESTSCPESLCYSLELIRKRTNVFIHKNSHLNTALNTLFACTCAMQRLGDGIFRTGKSLP